MNINRPISENEKCVKYLQDNGYTVYPPGTPVSLGGVKVNLCQGFKASDVAEASQLKISPTIPVYESARFEKLWNNAVSHSYKLMVEKGAEYAHGRDRLDNFRRNGAALGMSKEAVLMIYAGKHWDALQSYVRAGNNSISSEKITGRVLDLINYMYLFLAMLDENGESL